MTDYLDFLIETDAEVIAQLGFDEMASRIPGWDPIPGEIDTALIQANARIASQVRASAGIVPVGIFRYISDQFGLVPRAGSPSLVLTNWLFDDLLNHTIPAGTQLAIDPGDGSDLRTFELVLDLVESNGDGEQNDVLLQSVDLGVDNNDIPAPANVVLIDALPYVVNIVTSIDSYNGVQSETDAEFLERVVRRFALQSAAPILPGDFSAMALDVMPIGGRAIAIDGYDAVAATTGNARTITVFALDAAGAALSAPVKAQVVAYLASLREVNWLVYCADPVFFQVSVKWTAHAIPGFSTATVNANIAAAVNAYLNPATWGRPAIETLTNWTLLEGYDKVRLGELYELINRVEGVAYVDTLNLVAGAGPPAAQVADITLTGGQVVVPTTAGASVAGTVT